MPRVRNFFPRATKANRPVKKQPTHEELAADVLRVAKLVGVEPHSLRRAVYRANSLHYTSGDFDKVGGWSQLLATFFPIPKDNASTLQLKDLRKNQNIVSNAVGSQDLFLRSLKEIVKHLPPIKVVGYHPNKSKKKIERYINTVISDVHIGSDLRADETGHEYGLIEEARAMAMITKTTIEYKLPYREETGLNVFLNGDMIENLLHGASSSDLTQRQVWRAIYLIKQMISQFAINFRVVNVFCTTGNHDRDVAINPNRAIAQKFNSLATTIYYATKLATEDRFPHVRWHIPMTPWVDTVILGHRVRASHGDTFLNIGNPGTTLKIKLIEEKVNKINASLKDSNEIKVFILGHTHIPVITKLSNGSFLVINGSTQPPNSFVNSLDILETSNVQILFETTREFAVGDSRFIDINRSFKDSSLDAIIKPWNGLNG